MRNARYLGRDMSIGGLKDLGDGVFVAQRVIWKPFELCEELL